MYIFVASSNAFEDICNLLLHYTVLYSCYLNHFLRILPLPFVYPRKFLIPLFVNKTANDEREKRNY